MAITHDTATESHTGTTGSASEPSFSWSHAGSASAQGILVFTFVNADADDVLGVTYGGLNLAKVPGGTAIDTTTEPGRCVAWFHGTHVPGGTQTVVVTRNNNGNVIYAVSITVLAAAGKITSVAGVVLLENDGTLAEQNVNDGSPGANSVRYAGVNSGLGTPPAQGASSTQLHTIDFTARGISVCQETTAGQGSRPVGFSSGTSDDRAAVHLAVIEVAPGTVPGTPVHSAALA